ncbi:MAG: heavy metal-responsive transcriptional regulator [Gemmatimonadetes bacterium]|nr:heavy metal-responsive transcriptional regulator [Gemmatimonadota bacterium]
MRIGELAKTAGVTPDTIRYYEREGLLPAAERTRNGYRDYGPAALEDLLFIKKAQALGLKLADVREVLEISAGGKPPCEHVRATVTARLTEVEERLRELRGLRATLRETLERLDRAPAPKAGCRCAVIESA